MLSVADTGQGMDQETQAQIFEPFFTTKEQGKGTGLGLSTVYGIIKQSRGYILVESAPEQGANFRIYLPRVEDVAEPLKMAPPAAAASAGSETILLVEDEESVRQLVLETLQLRGYKILEAAEPEAALRIASSHSGRIDLLITDVVMPGTNGRELSRQITSLRPDTRVLYLSGYTEDAIIHQGVLEAGTPFLQKPFTLQMLFARVREVLSGERTPKAAQQ
jgi:CheY-like chemotaxis protein